MQCRTCGYALWNLSEPRCPECGQGFDLRAYRFRPGTVAFACPSCGALHGGSGEQYLPASSDEATCRACGELMQVRRMSVVPLTDDATAVEAQAMPWDDRRHLGLFRAWWRTFVMVLARPGELAQRTRPASGYGSSYVFALFTHLFVAIVHAVTCGGAMLLMMVSFTGMSGAGGGTELMFILMMVGFIVIGFLGAAAISPLLATLFIAAPAHMILCLIEPNRQRSFTVTARNVNYALAPMVFGAVPLLGLYCGWLFYVWTLVASTIMLAAAHRTSGGKAALAVLAVPVLLVVGYVGLIVLTEML
ncbi:MAG: YIP1 family protein [Phycisphaeraceae bacterium]